MSKTGPCVRITIPIPQAVLGPRLKDAQLHNSTVTAALQGGCLLKDIAKTAQAAITVGQTRDAAISDFSVDWKILYKPSEIDQVLGGLYDYRIATLNFLIY